MVEEHSLLIVKHYFVKMCINKHTYQRHTCLCVTVRIGKFYGIEAKGLHIINVF